jgi:5S rRNA maturation endonuclease (ribonuclease M5)
MVKKKGRPLGRPNIDYTNIDLTIKTYLQSLKEGQYTTIRHLYYKVKGFSPISYQTLGQHLTKLRKEEDLDDSKIADYTRKKIDLEAYPLSFKDREEFINTYLGSDSLISWFSKHYWENTSAYFELWIEKEAVSSVVEEVCKEYKIPVFISKGFCSHTWLKNLSSEIENRINRIPNQQVIILILTDRDKHGDDIDYAIRRSLWGKSAEWKEASPANLSIKRIGLTEDQVKKYGKEKMLEPNTTHSWEIDCLEDNELKNELEYIFQEYFKQHGIDIKSIKLNEEQERQKLEQRLKKNKKELENLKKKLWT